MGIHVKNIEKHFGDFKALNDVSLEIEAGELIALLGPSGSGKTTLLRIIAGLEFANSGEVIIDGEEAGDKHVRDRNVGFMFQHYALFKHMTVFENVAFGLRVLDKKKRPSEEEIKRKVLKLLGLVHHSYRVASASVSPLRAHWLCSQRFYCLMSRSGR
jgi:sulfate transport system ATP-binding protein